MSNAWRNSLSNCRHGAKMWFNSVAAQFPSQWVRCKMLQLQGAAIGRDTVIYAGTEVRAPQRLKIGTGSSIGHQCILDARGGLTVGDSVNFSTGVWIWTAEHDISSPSFAAHCAPVIIEDYAWLACRTTILPGVTIGKGAVIASGAVVTKSVPPFEIFGGVPARKIGQRNCDPNYSLKSCFPFV